VLKSIDAEIKNQIEKELPGLIVSRAVEKPLKAFEE
jgi:hypothetical protein